jgi:hypothetical protein
VCSLSFVSSLLCFKRVSGPRTTRKVEEDQPGQADHQPCDYQRDDSHDHVLEEAETTRPVERVDQSEDEPRDHSEDRTDDGRGRSFVVRLRCRHDIFLLRSTHGTPELGSSQLQAYILWQRLL